METGIATWLGRSLFHLQRFKAISIWVYDILKSPRVLQEPFEVCFSPLVLHLTSHHHHPFEGVVEVHRLSPAGEQVSLLDHSFPPVGIFPILVPLN